jgi:hypothetical protein
MANELEIKVKVTYTPTATNQVAISPGEFTKTISMSGSDHLSGTQSVGTSEEIIGDATNGFLTDIGTAGWILVKNLDSTNYVEFNSDAAPAANYTLRLDAGEFCVFRLGQANAILRGKANTAAVSIQYWVWED